MTDVHLIALAPGHFHAALVQKEMYPDVSPHVHVYAPLAPDLLAHLHRIAGFNSRKDNPTAWQLEVHASPDFFQRFVAERPGNVVVLSGRNHTKIGYIEAALDARLHVLADKPWIISAEDLPWLETVLTKAHERGLVALDVMTERHEITTILQRGLVADADVFGDVVTGSVDDPAVDMASVHYLMKLVAGVPLRRPAWFFDIHQQGEGLADVGTHLVDLVPWILFPEQPIHHCNDVALLMAKRWPTVLRREDFQKVTGEADFPESLACRLQDGRLPYFCNTLIQYTLRGVHVRLDIRWDFEAAAGTGDTHFAVFRGSRSRIEVHQGADQGYRPELYVVANSPDVKTALSRRVEKVQSVYPGVGIVDQGERSWVTIPDRYRVGHEAHFGEVTRMFLNYFRDPRGIPNWERSNMLAKYTVTTQGVKLSRSGN